MTGEEIQDYVGKVVRVAVKRDDGSINVYIGKLKESGKGYEISGMNGVLEMPDVRMVEKMVVDTAANTEVREVIDNSVMQFYGDIKIKDLEAIGESEIVLPLLERSNNWLSVRVGVSDNGDNITFCSDLLVGVNLNEAEKERIEVIMNRFYVMKDGENLVRSIPKKYASVGLIRFMQAMVAIDGCLDEWC